MAASGQRAIPSLGEALNRRLTEIQNGLSSPVAKQPSAEPLSAEKLNSAARDVESELSAWAGRAMLHHAEGERELKEIIAALAHTAESVATRDEKYSAEIGGLSGKLRGIAGMSNLGEIRRSIVESAAALKTCVERMAEDSRQSVHRLSAQVEEYRERLRVSEVLSSLDPLTDLANRRAFEKQLQFRIGLGKPFSLIVLDLDGFKKVNDIYGHLAGDDLLRQFAGELRSQFRTSDLVTRWGGDEFAVLVSGPLDQANERMERIRRWALGEYRIKAGDQTVTLKLSASMGSAEWNGAQSGSETSPETGEALIARADALVLRTKEKTRAA